jgi:hypothetical protein
MHTFDEEVSGEEKVIGRAAGPVDGAIVTDAEDDGRVRGDLRKSAETVSYGALG